MSEVRGLIEIAEHLQALGKGKADDSIFTGSEFIDEYGVSGRPQDEPPNAEIAFTGGDVGTAYSKVFNAVEIARNANEDTDNPYKIKGESAPELNIDVIVGHLDVALDNIDSALERIENILDNLDSVVEDPEYYKSDLSRLQVELIDIESHLEVQRDRIDADRIVVLR